MFMSMRYTNLRFIIIIIIIYKVHMLQFLHQMFNVSALLLDDALKPATPLTNGAISETLHRVLTIATRFCPLHRRRSWTSCSMFKMLQHVWSRGPGNLSAVCL